MRDVEETLDYVTREITASGLEGHVSLEDARPYFVPYALSSPAFVRRLYGQGISEDEVRRIVQAARKETSASRQRTIERDLLQPRRVSAATTSESLAKSRLRLDATQDPATFHPLTKDGLGRLAKLRTHPSATPLGRARRWTSRIKQGLGFTVHDVDTQTTEEAALRKLTERYGVQILTPNMLRAMREHEKTRGKGPLLSRIAVQGASLAPRTVWGAAKFLTKQNLVSWRIQRLQRRLSQTRNDEERIELEQQLAAARDALPYKRQDTLLGSLIVLWREARWALKLRLIVVLLLFLSTFWFIGWYGSLALLLQAGMVLFASLANLLLGGLNGVLWLGGGLFYLVSNLAIGATNALTAFIYDNVWKTIGRYVPGAEYSKPILRITVLHIPQLSYLLSLFSHYHADPTSGSVDLGLPHYYAIDASAHLVNGPFWDTSAFQFPTISKMALTCQDLQAFALKNGDPPPTTCEDFWTLHPEGAGGWLHELYCQAAPTDTSCTTSPTQGSPT